MSRENSVTVFIDSQITTDEFNRCQLMVANQKNTIKNIVLLTHHENTNILNLCQEWQDEDVRIKVFSDSKQKNIADFLSETDTEYCYFLSAIDNIPEDFLARMVVKAEITKADMVINRVSTFGAYEYSSVDFPLWSFGLIIPKNRTVHIHNDAKYIFNHAPNLNSQILYRTKFLQDNHLFKYYTSNFFGRKMSLSALIAAEKVVYADISGCQQRLSVALAKQADFQLSEIKNTICDIFAQLSKLSQADLLIRSFANFVGAWLLNLYDILPEPTRGKYARLLIEIADKYGFLNQTQQYFYDFSIYAGISDLREKKFIIPENSGKEIVPIVINCCNRNQLAAASVIISAIKKYANTNKFYDIYIAHGKDRNNTLCQILNKQSENNVSVRCIDICLYQALGLLGVEANTNAEDLLLIKVPALLFAYDKIICLSAFVLPLSDVSSLMNMSTDNQILIAAAMDYGDRKAIEAQDMIYESYINPDVMVVNSFLWNKENISFKCLLKINSEYKDIIQHQKDIINRLCFGRIQLLGAKWNTLVTKSCDIYDTDCYPRDLANINIIDYNGQKPWSNVISPFADIWWQYARISSTYEYMLTNSRSVNSKYNLNLDAKMIKKILARKSEFFPQMKIFVKEMFLSYVTFGKYSQPHKASARKILWNMMRRVS